MYGQFDTSNINYDSLQSMSANDDGALDWNSKFSLEEARSEDAPSLLPDGEYDFIVEDVERGNYQGGKKIPPCPKAILTLKVADANGKAHKVFNNIFLCKSMKWKIAELFESIGLIGPNGEINMENWDKAIGRSGKAYIKQRTYTNRDGIQKTVNDVSAYIPPKRSTSSDVIGATGALPF